MVQLELEQQEAQDPQEEAEEGYRPRPCEIGVGVAPRTAVVAPPVDTHRQAVAEGHGKGFRIQDSGFQLIPQSSSSYHPVLVYSFPLMCIVKQIFFNVLLVFSLCFVYFRLILHKLFAKFL